MRWVYSSLTTLVTTLFNEATDFTSLHWLALNVKYAVAVNSWDRTAT